MNCSESEMMHYALEIKRYCQQTKFKPNSDSTRVIPCESCIFATPTLSCKIAGVFLPNEWRI